MRRLAKALKRVSATQEGVILMDITCTTTKEKIANSQGSVSFPCPKCGKETIVRSGHARAIAAVYTCPACTFEGP